MEPTEILPWAATIFGALLILGLAIPYFLEPIAEYRRREHERRMAEIEAVSNASQCSHREKRYGGIDEDVTFEPPPPGTLKPPPRTPPPPGTYHG